MSCSRTQHGGGRSRTSIAGIKCLKEHCQIIEICVQHIFLMLIDYILVYYTAGSIKFFEQYRYAAVANDW